MPFLRTLLAGLLAIMVVVGGLLAAFALFFAAWVSRLFGGRTRRPPRAAARPRPRDGRVIRADDAIEVESSVVVDDPEGR